MELYNAVSHSQITDIDQLHFNTIKEVLYLGMHNDISFLIMNEVNLYEQQSSFNPNMPLRFLQYAAELYEKYLEQNRWNKYGSRQIELPVPKLVVFYNGTREQPDEMILKLSDAFPEEADSDIEIKVRMINVNYGRNQELLNTCKPLQEYSWLTNEIRENKRKGESLDSAVDHAILSMPDDFVIKSLLMAHRAEVKDMLLTEYNEVEQMKLWKEEGIFETLSALVRDNILTVEEAAARAGVSEKVFRRKMIELDSSKKSFGTE